MIYGTIKTEPQVIEKGAEKFPEQEKFAGEVRDLNYGVVPTEKDAVLENLKKAGEDARNRFGLNEMGMTPDPKADTSDK